MTRVDYDAVARTYQAGRSDFAQAELVRQAIEPYLPRPRRPLRVLDLGAGTGIFTRIWPEWGAREVVALDPSPAMLAEARQVGMPAEARLVVGRGEDLPLRPAWVDVAWISAVFHHLTDARRCLADLDRVLTDEAVVLVRTHFPDLADAGWFEVFPGVDRAMDRFPRLGSLTELFAAAGFERRGVEALPAGRAPASAARSWAQRMRHADSFLIALTDDEIATGLEALDRMGDATVPLVTLRVAAFGRLRR